MQKYKVDICFTDGTSSPLYTREYTKTQLVRLLDSFRKKEVWLLLDEQDDNDKEYKRAINLRMARFIRWKKLKPIKG